MTLRNTQTGGGIDETRILIVDDEKDIVFLFGERLRRLGYAVDMAFDAAEASVKVLQFKPHLVLLDIRIAEGGGISVLDKIRKNPETCLTPVVIMTANYDPDIKEKAYDLGVSDYLIKPFDINTMIEKIGGIFNEK